MFSWWQPPCIRGYLSAARSFQKEPRASNSTSARARTSLILHLHPTQLQAVVVPQHDVDALADAPGKPRLVQRNVADFLLVNRQGLADKSLALGRIDLRLELSRQLINPRVREATDIVGADLVDRSVYGILQCRMGVVAQRLP